VSAAKSPTVVRRINKLTGQEVNVYLLIVQNGGAAEFSHARTNSQIPGQRLSQGTTVAIDCRTGPDGYFAHIFNGTQGGGFVLWSHLTTGGLNPPDCLSNVN